MANFRLQTTRERGRLQASILVALVEKGKRKTENRDRPNS